VAQYRERVQKSPSADARPAKLYGSCFQAMSLHGLLSKVGENAIVPPNDTERNRDGAVFDESYFAVSVIDTVNIGSQVCCVSDERIGSLCKEEALEPHVGPLLDGPCLLCDDATAKRLALEHGASAVLPWEAMMELLRRPGHESTRWSIPLLRTNFRVPGKQGLNASVGDLLVLEEPFPVQCTTREWLTKGFFESLKRKLNPSALPNNPGSCKTPPKPSIQYVYSLLTLPPQSHGRHASTKVLVRTANEFLDETGRPIRLRMNLEYFSERGMEIPTAHERAVWIMEKFLQPSCRILFSRVDPKTARVIGIEEKGIAHALAHADNEGKNSSVCNPLSHFDAFLTVMRGITNLRDNGRYILCLPGRGVSMMSAATSATVHKECSEEYAGEETSKTTTFVSFERELSVADSVFTSQPSLMTCYRAWEWTSDRLPYTFPTE